MISGVPLRDMQYAMRQADARTTIRYDMARAKLDRHAAHSVAAYLRHGYELADASGRSRHVNDVVLLTAV